MSITVWTSEIKWAYLGGNSLSEIYVGTTKVRPAETVQTFDFQNDWDLGWTGVNVYGMPYLTSGEWWGIGNSTSGFQSPIMPPSSIYDGKTLTKVKIRFYKPNIHSGYTSWGAWLCNSSLTTAAFYDISDYALTWVNVYVWGKNHITSTSNVSGEITEEYTFQNGEIIFTLNGSSYNLWAYASYFQDLWENQALGLTIARWNASKTGYIRKVEIYTE